MTVSHSGGPCAWSTRRTPSSPDSGGSPRGDRETLFSRLRPPTRRRRALLLWLALGCWACAVLWLSSLSPEELPDAAFRFWDKANHFAAFTLGGWLAATALHTSGPRAGGRRVIASAVLLLAGFGALDESLQTLTPGRTGADLADWTADVLGALAGATLSRRVR